MGDNYDFHREGTVVSPGENSETMKGDSHLCPVDFLSHVNFYNESTFMF